MRLLARSSGWQVKLVLAWPILFVSLLNEVLVELLQERYLLDEFLRVLLQLVAIQYVLAPIIHVSCTIHETTPSEGPASPWG